MSETGYPRARSAHSPYGCKQVPHATLEAYSKLPRWQRNRGEGVPK